MLPAYSRKSILQIEDTVQKHAEYTCDRFLAWAQADNYIVNLSVFWFASALDFVTATVFGESVKSLEDKDKASELAAGFIDIETALPLVKHLPVLIDILMNIPISLARVLQPRLALLLTLRKVRLYFSKTLNHRRLIDL